MKKKAVFLIALAIIATLTFAASALAVDVVTGTVSITIEPPEATWYVEEAPEVTYVSGGAYT